MSSSRSGPGREGRGVLCSHRDGEGEGARLRTASSRALGGVAQPSWGEGSCKSRQAGVEGTRLLAEAVVV